MKTILLFLIVSFFVNHVVCDVPPADRAALVNFYNALDGPSWSDNSNWLVDDPCANSWFGITCSGDTITSLYFRSRNNLVGTIPSDFSLSGLTEL